jgi:DNA-binding transcriptional LysR family regulator
MPNFREQRLHWDDLHLILVVARAGSFARAAEKLGISTPTVFRRAKELEQRLGTLIFRRGNTGVSLTPAGRDAVALAEGIEEQVSAFEVRVGNADVAISGSVRLATVDTLIAGPLMPILVRFRSMYPDIGLDLRSGIGMADLRQREVDAALRAGGEPPESLVGRKLCRIAVAVYRGVSSPDPVLDDLGCHPWVVPGEELGHLASARWLKERGLLDRAALRVNSLHSLALAVSAGFGLGVLPCYLADAEPRLVRVGEPIPELSGDLWFLTHSELQHTGRIRALSDLLARELRALRPLFHGHLEYGKANRT